MYVSFNTWPTTVLSLFKIIVVVTKVMLRPEIHGQAKRRMPVAPVRKQNCLGYGSPSGRPVQNNLIHRNDTSNHIIPIKKEAEASF